MGEVLGVPLNQSGTDLGRGRLQYYYYSSSSEMLDLLLYFQKHPRGGERVLEIRMTLAVGINSLNALLCLCSSRRILFQFPPSYCIPDPAQRPPCQVVQ